MNIKNYLNKDFLFTWLKMIGFIALWTAAFVTLIAVGSVVGPIPVMVAFILGISLYAATMIYDTRLDK